VIINQSQAAKRHVRRAWGGTKMAENPAGGRSACPKDKLYTDLHPRL